MIRIGVMVAPTWIDLVGTARVLVRPHSAVVKAQAMEDPALQALAEDAAAAVRSAAFIEAIARAGVLDWEGFGDAEGVPVPFDPELIGAVLAVDEVRDAFLTKYVSGFLRLDAEKKGSAPLPDGTLAGAPNIAVPAPDDAMPAPEG